MIRKTSFYAFSVCLIVWYLQVLFWSINPNVSHAYRLYYIEKELVEWSGNDALDYTTGETVDFGSGLSGKESIKFLGTGWSHMEEWGTWTDGEWANVFFVMNKDAINADQVLTINATAFSKQGPRKINIFINQKLLQEISVEPEIQQELKVKIPKNFIEADGFLHLQFQSKDLVSPKQLGISEDNRLIGLWVHSLKIDND
ncbi:DUF7024 domain-containing protein [Paenibacillus hodogayensis]|uniref:DUF7024 domain-containing protein n=1 Tax=Paenibacillus hodogayensis TaxID=279208 RepID=A0ABV5VRZ8_9BACL